MNYILRKINIKALMCFNAIIFILYTFVNDYILVNYSMGTPQGNWRYYFLFGAFVISMCTYLLNKKINKVETKCKELLLLIIPATVFFLFSIIYSYKAHMPFSFRTIVQISMFLLPALYAFTIINNFELKKVYKLFQIATLITIFFYFFESRHTIIEFFKLSNWANISFLNSSSFTESHNFFDTFLQLFLFFNYYSKYEKDNCKKKLKWFKIISAIFTILSFKRLGVLFVLFILIYNRFDNQEKYKNKNYNVFLITTIIIAITLLYTKILQGQVFNVSPSILDKITSGRRWFIEMWRNKNYFSYGYGTSMFVIGRFLEMDLVEILLELNVFCLFVFVYYFIKISSKNIYSFLIMMYVMLNMLTSSSLPWTYGWIIMFVTTSSISNNILRDGNNKL